MSYYGAEDATDVIVIMGSGSVTVRETVEHLNKNGGKTGVLVIHLYRPFDMPFFISKLPLSCKRISVLDRCKEPGATGEPLKLDVMAALIESGHIHQIEKIIGGKYGLASKDFIPADVEAVFDNLKVPKSIDHFTCSINDDVTFKSLPRKNLLTLVPEGTK